MRKQALGLAVAAALCALASCGTDNTSIFDGRSNDGGGAGNDGGPSFDFGDGSTEAGPCVGLQCQQVACPGGGSTTLTGKVFAPEGTIPLYNVIVYVPNTAVEPFKAGAQCDKCGNVSGSPVVSALTNEKGEFKLENVPVGSNIPLVVQVGKWRRQLKIPAIVQCQENRVPTTDTRLPRSTSEGDMPQIAITSGSADSLECFLRRMGIADSEFTLPTGNGRVHYYTGNGATMGAGTPAAATLWDNVATLKKYDISILSCEGSERTADKQPYYANIKDYLDAGGRVFASHYHYVWFRYGTAPLPTTSNWGQIISSSPYTVDTSFPKGNSFADWLVNIGVSTARGQIDLAAVRYSAKDSNPAVSRQWIYSPAAKSTQYFSFNTPIGSLPASQCGRGVFTDVHVSVEGANGTFPGFCANRPLNDNEKALLFLFFDLSSCIGDDSKPPKPPPPR